MTRCIYGLGRSCVDTRWSDIVVTSNIRTAFSGADVVVMLAKLDRKCDENRRDFLQNIVEVSRQHGAAIDKFANKTVKVTDSHG